MIVRVVLRAAPLLAVALCLAAQDAPAAGLRRVEAVELSWDELTAGAFEPRWILPDDLPVDRESGAGPDCDLTRTMRALVALVAEPAPQDPLAPRCLGDVVAGLRTAGGDAPAHRAVLDRLQRSQPALYETLSPFISELLCDDALRSPEWDPDEDDACDGLLFARPLTLAKRPDAPWKQLDGSDLVWQGAALMHADVEAIKAAENDYSTYPARPGTTYESIGPAEGSHVRGHDPAGRGFAALRVDFECDLPFPFSTYRCDLRVLNRIDAAGSFVCDIYSTSPDFYWLAGRDTFLPVRASDGTWVSTLVVRLFGFDLVDIPDGDGDQRASLRSSLGSLKRGSEAAFRAAGAEPRTVEGQVPEFAVLGSR